MTFTHPLARDAKVWSTAGSKGKPKRILVVITGLALDQDHAKYKPEQIERLSAAAKEWLKADTTGVSDFLLMNRPKKWLGDKD